MKFRFNIWQERPIFLLTAVWLASFILTACSRQAAILPPFPQHSVEQPSGPENTARRALDVSADEISFTNLTVEEGLSQSSLACIFQDSQGFLWFCTFEGADRFDGYEFVNFSHNPQNPNTLRDNLVTAIVEDQQGNLWFGTQTGLDIYHPETGKIDHISLGVDEDVVITSLLVDQNGDLWVGAHQGVFHLEFENNQILKTTQFRLLDMEGYQVDRNPVGFIFQDSQGIIWVGTGQGLGSYDPQIDSFVWELISPLMAENAVTQAIIEIEPGILLLGGGYGLLFFKDHTNQTTSFSADEIFLPSSKLDFGMVWSIIRADDGAIWIGTDTGLFRIESDFKKGLFLPQIQEDPNAQEFVTTIFQDQEGNIWVGTLTQGLFVHRSLQQKFKLNEAYIQDVLQQDSVWSLYEDRDGFLWVGTDRELLKIDRFEHQVDRYPYRPDLPESFVDAQVNTMIEDGSGTLWIGTSSGHIYFYDRDNNSFSMMFAEEIPPGYPINRFYLDQDGDIWIGTLCGLYWYQVGQKKVHYFVHDPQNPIAPIDDVAAIQEDESGVLWIGTWGGLDTFDKTTGQLSHVDFATPNEGSSTIDNSIISILPDRSGGLWLGSQSGGLHHYDISTGTLVSFRDTDGITDGAILAILEDNQGNLWLSTQRGLSKFSPELGIFTHYAHEDGLPSNEFNAAYFQSQSAELFFGGIDGFVAFYPEEVLQNAAPPPITLTEITQNGEKISLETPVDQLKTLTLSWPNNYFEFEFAALSFINPEDNQYAYYLEGIDPDWVYAGKNRTGRYVDLPGGTYTLHLIGSNNDGVWNSEGIEFQITIIPPIWQRLWFQIAVAFGFVMTILGGYRYRVRRILARAHELESLVNERTTDLSRINEQLLVEIVEREKAEHRLSQRIAAEAILTERNRLARDLHDAVTQTIFSASILSEALPHTLEANPGKGRQQIEELQQLTRGALAELRSLLFELRPEGLVKTDLKELLAQLGKGVTGRSGIPVEIDCHTQVEIPSEVKITLYRIAQEALNNASRHADASRIKILCNGTQEIIRLAIQDDGKGFDYREKIESRMGLGIMQERAADIGASLEVESQPGVGTTILVEWLFPKNGVSDE